MKILIIGETEWLSRFIEGSTLMKQFEIVTSPVGASDEILLELGKDAEIIIADSMSVISGALIWNMHNLKLIHTEGVGYQGVDINAARECHVSVCNAKGINAKAVAEHAVMLMLALLRNIKMGERAVRDGRQIAVKDQYMSEGSLRELGECTVGLIGFGDIGKALTQFLNAFGAKVVYFDAFRASAEVEEQYQVSYLPMDELLAVSDIVSLHLPVLESTRYMGNAAFFAKMKPGAYFINTARGELVETSALLDAIRSGHVAAAGLDCIDGEPVQADNPILHTEQDVADRLLLSCHIAGVTGSTLRRGFDIICRNIEHLLAGEPLMNVVNQ